MPEHQQRDTLDTRGPLLANALRVGLLALVTGFVVACGPIEYVNQVTRRASSEVAAAKSVNAAKFAPYWYTLAVEYLNKAREEAASADFQAANRFGRRSAEAARKARLEALKRAKDPASVRSFRDKETSEDSDTDNESESPNEDKQ